MPVLAVIAGRSVMHDPVAALDTAERVLPAGSVKSYPEATHAINGEYPDALAADIGELLERADAP